MRFNNMNFFKKVSMELFLLCLLLSSLSVLADGNYDAKAHHIYQFAQYIEWNTDDKTLTFCVVGENPFGNRLAATIANKKINGHNLEFKSVTGNQLSTCDIAFVSHRNELNQVLHAAHPMLTIIYISDFAERGGMIEFIETEGKLRFVINRNAAARVGIKISSQLLKLAQKIF